jgi:pimeloyl-ACP methyl ester carboxylesterase
MGSETREELVSVGDRKVDLRRAGSGPPLLYLHSAMGDFWMPEFVQALAGSFEVICPAQPGFGESTGIEEISDIEDMAFHYLDLIDELGLEQPHLAGLSLGGWIAAEVAVRWPGRLGSLALIDAAGLRLPELPIPPIWGIKPAELAELLFSDQANPLAMLIASIDFDNLPPEDMLLSFINAQSASAKIAWDPYLHDPKLASRLHRISCPTLAIWTQGDKLFPAEYGKEYARLIPGARLEVIDGGGHLGALEKPELFSKALAGFLEKI